jgi:hypothetical protein
MRRILAASFLMALFIAHDVDAHHAAAGIDRSKTVTVEGSVKQFKWGNPHCWLDLEVKSATGQVDIWSLEMTSPAYLVRAGWKATTLKAGDKVKFTARPFKNGDPGGIFVSVTLPDGRTLTEQAQPAGTQAPARGTPPAPAQPTR